MIPFHYSLRPSIEMDVLLVGALLLVALCNGQPIPEAEADPESDQKFVPGVFISADVLKDLQQKAQQNQLNQQLSPPITNVDSKQIGDNLKINPNANLPIESRSQQQVSSQPTIQAGQPLPLPNQNQPILTQPINNQPILQTVPSNQIVVQRQSPPNFLIQQPGNQVMLQNPGNQMIVQPGNQLLVQQPGNQLLVQQPGNQMFLQPRPGNVFVNQQPGNQVFLQQPPQGNQLFVNQQPNQQIVLPNGQVAQVVGQPSLISNNLPTNQIPNNVVLQNNRPVNAGTVYAVVPVNGQNNMQVPNTNLGNGNTYLVPVQQMPNQMYVSG